jgi:hypothetical protein
MNQKYDFDLYQQIYCFSMISGAIGQTQGSEKFLQDALIETLNDSLPKLPGNWTISWGPRVFQEKNPEFDEGGPDNTWFAVTNETQNICAVAIAGTAGNSIADIYQDFAVVEVVDFDAWVKQWSQQDIPHPATCEPINESTVAYCAKGTCVGVWNVLGNVSTATRAGMRIDEYLRSLDPKYTIVFTGHSLGGALAPMAALGLAKANLIGDHTVKTLPSAGVSPGNKTFATEYAAVFPKDPAAGDDYRVFNTDYYNMYDIVPQAWSVQLCADRNLFNILGQIVHCTPDYFPKAVLTWAVPMGLSLLSRIQYTPLQGQSFKGEQPPEEFSSASDILDYMSTGHVFSYWRETGIYDFMTSFTGKLSKRLGSRGVSAS